MTLLARRGLAAWRRSLQVRVVAGTLVLSTVVVVLASWMLLRQVSEGILQEKIDSSIVEASSDLRSTKVTIDAAEPTGDTNRVLLDLSEDIAMRARTSGLYEVGVRIVKPNGDDVPPVAEATMNTPLVWSVPDDLTRSLRIGQVSYRFVSLVRTDGSMTPNLVIGSQLRESDTNATFNLYYFFDLRQQQDILDLLQRSLIAVGSLLVLLLGLVAWFVTRQVVSPVRMAREIAERLAAGRLDQRMRVRGEDDLARLATSFNQMAASLQRQIRQLEELSRVQRRFVSDVSHELRTPITTVRMAADVLHDARRSFDPSIARSAELLQNELDRFEALLTDLLEISRFDAGAAALELDDVDFRPLVRQVVDAAQPLATRKGSRLVLDLPDTACVAEVDPRRLVRVLRNLVINAIEYGEGRDVEIRVASDEQATAVSVRDHGIGLKPGESAMVFDRFWRADPARARTTGGTGLGLAIAMEDVLLHGGWLQAWGSPGEGAHFRLTVPRRPSEPLDHSPIPLVPDDARRPFAELTASPENAESPGAST
ncbi:MtrAB system histidine kinase MtrB [Tenggerimyces flavus]|uniref:Sensor histidine kinase MtrB n=1 Tax=Tenggerimyces flavus TaxID=1708749 RepID=A0ABV7YQ26_9ACTN|nr:MtrAB system histidine kinase MtrB [Tenggerimyces flavus]MBM7786206.1 two-component system sensor histidine kinase MtrB [Tenggerimyces flavus]